MSAYEVTGKQMAREVFERITRDDYSWYLHHG